MRVSIITTCYNRVNTIGDAIESVLEQDYPKIEYIVVDGASTDGSVEVINRYKDRLAAFVSEPDRGMYEAINKGIRLATGDVVGLLHSDDCFFDREVISRIVTAFEMNQAEMIYGNGIFVDQNNPEKVVRDWVSSQYKYRGLKVGWLPLHTTVYFRGDVLGRYGLYNETYQIAADTELLIRYLYKYQVKAHYVNTYIVRMRMGGASTSRSLHRIITKWNEDVRAFKRYNMNPFVAVPAKIIRKLPQYIRHRWGRKGI